MGDTRKSEHAFRRALHTQSHADRVACRSRVTYANLRLDFFLFPAKHDDHPLERVSDRLAGSTGSAMRKRALQFPHERFIVADNAVLLQHPVKVSASPLSVPPERRCVEMRTTNRVDSHADFLGRPRNYTTALITMHALSVIRQSRSLRIDDCHREGIRKETR